MAASHLRSSSRGIFHASRHIRPNATNRLLPTVGTTRARRQSNDTKVITSDYFGDLMKAVGVKQLKARLSEYRRQVRAGETVLVTDREEIVAELRPARRHGRWPLESTEEILDALASKGEVTRSAASKKKWTWKVRGLGLPPGTADKLLDEIRGDR
jgi:antitoxin (DNA-binding transcriptional repressor) of toxin-antitoxin stability system